MGDISLTGTDIFCNTNNDCINTTFCCSTYSCVHPSKCLHGYKVTEDVCDYNFECFSRCCFLNQCSHFFNCYEPCMRNSDCASSSGCCSEGYCTHDVVCLGNKVNFDYCDSDEECLSRFCQHETKQCEVRPDFMNGVGIATMIGLCVGGMLCICLTIFTCQNLCFKKGGFLSSSGVSRDSDHYRQSNSQNLNEGMMTRQTLQSMRNARMNGY